MKMQSFVEYIFHMKYNQLPVDFYYMYAHQCPL